MKPDSLAGRLRTWLTENPDGARASQIAVAMGVTTTQACLALGDLHRKGHLVRCKVEVPGKAAEYQCRLSATAGAARHGQPWATMPVVGAPKPPRPECTTRPRGEAPTPGKPASMPATALPPVQAAPVAAQESVAAIQSSVPAPVVDERPPTALGDALRDLERTLDPDAPLTRQREEAITQAAAEAPRDWEPEPTPEPPPAMTPRFGLFSDGTLILEGLPNLPHIIAIRREHTRALVDYLRAVDQ